MVDAGAARRGAIRRIIGRRGTIAASDPQFRGVRDGALAAWAELLASRAPDVAIASIHGFDGPASDRHWQRHGIARASAALGGALVVAAAHFERLPSSGTSTLAACGVPKRHLTTGAARPACALRPSLSLPIVNRSGSSAMLRLFEAPPATRGKVGPR